jgi:hypothetical protein
MSMLLPLSQSQSLSSVFLTPELLEAIFFHLPLQDLLRVQRVCRGWRDIIAETPTLQRKLFLQPAHASDTQPEFNPLLQKIFPNLLMVGDPLQLPEIWICTGDLLESNFFVHDIHRTQVLRPEASWRRMFPVQPPAKIEEFHENSGCCDRTYNYGVIASSFQNLQSSGASMGLIYDICVHLLEGTEGMECSVQWHMFPHVSRLNKEANLNPKNKITIHTGYFYACYSSRMEVSTGLKVGDCDPDLIDYGEKGRTDDWLT